jgi:ABC-type branched-subunit amino acid transport system substrate-binding protein
VRSRVASVIAIVLVLSIVVTGCAPKPTPTAVPPTKVPPTAVPPTKVPPTAVPPTAVPPPPAPAAIEIGASIPSTGKYASLAAMVKPGYEIAVADINAAGGVYVKEYDKKIPLHLTIYDDESDPTKTVTKMESLYSEQKVVVYLGGAGSDMHAAAAGIAEKNKVPNLGIAFAQ